MNSSTFAQPSPQSPGRRRLKFLLLGLGVVLSMGFLVVVGFQQEGGFSYYLSVTEFLQTGTQGTDGFRVNGKVTEGTIERATTGQDVTFLMSDGTSSLRVSYHGIIPDTFVDGADVVVEGGMVGDTFEADLLLAKCPSKYESADEAGGYGN